MGHSHIKRVLSALKADKIKWEVRFMHAIKRTGKMKLAAHLRARWSSRLNKYKLARAKLYKKLRQNDILLAREINMRQKIIEKQSGQTKRRMGMEVNRKHAIGHMKETAERYAAHLKEQTLKILKRKQNNNAAVRRVGEKKNQILRRLKRRTMGEAIEAKKSRKEGLVHARGLKNKENEITRSVFVKRRLREVMIGEVAKKQKITAQLRIAQKRFRKYIHHGYEQLEAIKKMQTKLRRLRRNVMEQKVKQRQDMSRAAKLDKIIIAIAALLRRVQAEHAHVVAAFRRRRRAERAMLTFKQRSLRGSSIEALHVHKALAG